VHESGDLGDFGNEADAIAYAHKWAIEWIDERMNPVVRLKDKNDKDKDWDDLTCPAAAAHVPSDFVARRTFTELDCAPKNTAAAFSRHHDILRWLRRRATCFFIVLV
jgi:hypothetical protein